MQEQFLRLNDVTRLTGLRRSTVYTHARSGKFPKPITIGGTVTAWLATEVTEWMRAQIVASRPSTESPGAKGVS
jgi:prophage regulatory protein